MAQVIENIGGEYRNRTGVHGFAIRCVTTPPTRRPVVRVHYMITGRAARYMIGELCLRPLLTRARCGTS